MRHLLPFRILDRLFDALVILVVLGSSLLMASQPKPVFAQAEHTQASVQYQSISAVSADSSKPAAFKKKKPPKGDMGTSINLTLTWTASSNATEYQYCTSTTSSDTCSKSWKSVGTALSVSLTNLKFSKTYYWQVRAVNSKGKTYANSGSWWSFTTKESPPGSFKKHDPEKGATSVSTHPSLNWGSSSNAVYYQYCYDTNNDDTCNGTWKKTAGKEVKLSSLNKNTTYYWQVRAVNENATTYANSGAWWSFTIKK